MGDQRVVEYRGEGLSFPLKNREFWLLPKDEPDPRCDERRCWSKRLGLLKAIVATVVGAVAVLVHSAEQCRHNGLLHQVHVFKEYRGRVLRQVECGIEEVGGPKFRNISVSVGND